MNPDQEKFILSDAFSKVYDRLSPQRPFPCSKADFRAAFLAAWSLHSRHEGLVAALRGVDIREVKQALREAFAAWKCEKVFACWLDEIIPTAGESAATIDMGNLCDEMIRDQQSTQEPPGSPAGGEEVGNLVEEQEISEAQRSDPLSLLYNPKCTKRGTAARKDNFFLKHYRGTRRSIKYLMKGKKPTSNLLKTTVVNDTNSAQYSALQDFYEANSQELKQWCEDFDEYMPMSKIYERKVAKEYNSVFTNWLYCESPENMCEKFKVKCCKGKEHTDRCWEVWALVKDYMNNLGVRNDR